MLGTDWTGAADECGKIIDYVSQISGGVFPYDNRIFAADWDVNEDPVSNFFSPMNSEADNIYS